MNVLRLMCLGLMAGAGIFAAMPFSSVGGAPPGPTARPTAQESLVVFLTNKSTADLRRWPLFDADNGAAAGAPAATAGEVVLVGVVRGREHRALLAFGADKPVWVSEGQAARGLTLVKVESSSVALRGRTGMVEVSLYETPANADSGLRTPQAQGGSAVVH